jgi:hypothetical protein
MEFGGRISEGYFFGLIRRPGSALLIETKLPCASRVVPNLSLVRPANSFCSSRTTDVSSLKPGDRTDDLALAVSNVFLS